jgi:hypothetical protein
MSVSLLKSRDMVIDIETILGAIDAFSTDEAEFFHNTLGISDVRADALMTDAEDVVYDFLEREDSEWDVEQCVKEMLLKVKFLGLSSTEALFYLMHGYAFLGSHVESKDFFLIESTLNASNLRIDMN